MSAQNAVNAPKSFTGLLEPVKVTRCGVRTSFEDELPNPSCPLLFLPQHFTDWSSNKAQDAPLESAILIALRPEPKSTAVGTQTPPDEASDTLGSFVGVVSQSVIPRPPGEAKYTPNLTTS